jgi:Fur family ferric uptake transcriptional regulator
MPDATADQLRSHGLRVTAPRSAVLRAVTELPGHPDAELIARRARALIGTVSTQSVYDSLHTLTRVGLLRRIEPAGSPARYETRVGDNHHHRVCRVCGTVEDVDCATGGAPCIDGGDGDGFVVDEAEVTFWGACADCRNGQAR